MVKAGSVPKGQNLCASPIASMTRPFVGVLPCKNSKNPWFTPENDPKNTPMVVAITRVAFRLSKDGHSLFDTPVFITNSPLYCTKVPYR